IKMECSNMKQHHQYGAYAEPRISFSSGFAATKNDMVKYKEAPVSSDDFEFGVNNFSMITADEIFFDGMILPLKEEVNTTKRMSTLREELSEEDSDSPRSKSKGSSGWWRERLGLGFVKSKKDHKRTMADDHSLLSKDSFVMKLPKQSSLVLRMVVLFFVMVCTVYICSICLKQIGVSPNYGFLNVEVFERPCPEPNIEPWDIPFLHYPKPNTYNRDECSCQPVRYFAIISMQRSGSGWFETLLNNHTNISSNGEIFSNKDRRANVSSIFETLDKGLMKHQEEIVEYFKTRGVSSIFLFRRNLLRRIISVLANTYDRDAKLLNGTHKSHVHSPKEAEILAGYKPVINTSLLITELKKIQETTLKALAYFNTTRHILLHYEDVVENRIVRLDDVQEFLKVPKRELKSRQVKIHLGSLSQHVQNWEEVQTTLKGTNWSDYLEMEERRRDTGGTLASAGSSGDSPASEPTPRRRVKRKSNALGASNSSSTSSKRMLTREKAMLASFSPVHNGPLTRARQAPSNMPSAAEAKPELLLNAADGEKPKEEEERNKAIREWEALEAKIEADFEGVRSRGSNVHVVPNHCGWFSWGKIHPLEERSLPSFFNGKLEGRSSDVYIEIRDWIMRKFHSNPNTQLEGKDLTELEVGDVEAKQEVMEFLDYWGLINFHPFPPPDASSSGGERVGVGDKESLLNSLYRFQADEASSMAAAFVQKPRLAAQATTPSGMFPDPMAAAADDWLKQEGPAVEYHCNSCSADCSLKRYHCPKQADFDLCTECFDSGKFSSDMSSSDFILLEPAKDPGVGSGKWTDQETLLLLEGLEIFKENWSEIAEHVATKTKAQCMLHFLQMPIEDAFLDQIDNKDPSSKDTTDIAVSKDEKPVQKEAPVEKENTNHVVEVEAVKEAPEKEDDNEGKVPQESSSKPGDASEETKEVEADQKTPKVETVIAERCKDEADENIALKALTEAFEDVGYPITPEASLSFADLGNPVMGLAAFLVRLAGADVATASARASVKSLNSNSGLLLATRHCFVLDDPPENKTDLTESKSVDAEDVSLISDDREMTDTDPGKENQDSVSEEKQPGSRTEISARNPDSKGPKVYSNAAAAKSSEKPPDIICKLQDKSSGKELKDPLKDGNKLSSEKKAASKATVSKAAADASQPEASKDVEMKDTLQSEKDPQDMVKTAGEKVEQAKEDVHSMPDTSVAEQPIGSAFLPENGTGEKLNKEGSKEKNVCAVTKDKHNSDKLKRAAISALSAAAVKAKHLAKLEEDQIRQLSGSLIEKQLHKLEAKLSIFNDAESLTARVREQLERSRQRLYHERAQIIASRLGVPPSVSSKASLPANRIATNFANVAHRPPMGMAFPRPPMPRPPDPAPCSDNELSLFLGESYFSNPKKNPSRFQSLSLTFKQSSLSPRGTGSPPNKTSPPVAPVSSPPAPDSASPPTNNSSASSPPPAPPSQETLPPPSPPPSPPVAGNPPPKTPENPSPPSPESKLRPPRSSGGSDSSSSSPGENHYQANVGLIIGVLVGAGLLLLLLVLICICCKKKKKKRDPQVNHLHYYNNSPFGAPNDHVVNMGGGNWVPQQPVSGPHSDTSNLAGPTPSPQAATLGHNQSTFTYDELSIATEGFAQSNLLGQGGFGYVHKGVLPGGKEVAVKSLKVGSGQGEREFQAEVEIISRVHHRHLVSLVGYCISGGQRLLVYEFLPNNTLEFHLYGKGRPVLEWSIRLKIALGSARGLAYLHEDCHPKIIHRDIKAANILLDFSFETKVADFGLAKLSQDNYTHVSTRVMGTFGYLAPEYASSGKLSDKSDVFSFGVMLLELITGRPPVDLTGEMEDSLVDWARPLCMKAAQDGDYSQLADPRLETSYNQQEMAQMASCAAAAISHSARRRPKMSQIVRALEGDMSMEDLNEGGRPGQNSYLSPGGMTSEYDASSYSADMKKIRKLALETKEYQSSEYGATSEYGLHPSASSSEEMHRGSSMRRNSQL
ncbi:hypothetical protein HID58_040319, partial [Brassica napus]